MSGNNSNGGSDIVKVINPIDGQMLAMTQYAYNDMMHAGFLQMEGHGSNTYYGYTFTTQYGTMLTNDASQIAPALDEVGNGQLTAAAEGVMAEVGTAIGLNGAANLACIGAVISAGSLALSVLKSGSLINNMALLGGAMAAAGACASLAVNDFGDHSFNPSNSACDGVCGIG